MVVRQLELDDDTDRILADLAKDYPGGVSEAVADLVRSHEGIEDMVEQGEEANPDELLRQRDQSKREFGEGKFVTWEEVKRRNRM